MKEIIEQQFELQDRDAKTMPSLSLAFLGDSVYELVIRTVLMAHSTKPHELSRLKNRLVNAGAQARVLERILAGELLTQEELAVVKRGRNAHPHTIARHASLSDYHMATALECLVGWLYERGEEERLVKLIREGIREELEKLQG